MQTKYVIHGGKVLSGQIALHGAKNVALKTLAATLLTDDEVIIDNVPDISDLRMMVNIVQDLGATAELTGNHQLKIVGKTLRKNKVDLDMGAHLRTSSMVIAPLLARTGEAVIPNPGGCRIGARPIDRHIDGLKKMGVEIDYSQDDGYFYAKTRKLKGCTYRFKKNTHTGTETMMLAATLAEGETVLENAAAEPEIDDLIKLLVAMGADIKRQRERTIVIRGVKKLHGVRHFIIADRNEAVTFAIAAYITLGDITVTGVQRHYLKAFLAKLDESGAGWEPLTQDATRFYYQGSLKATQVTTMPHPGFMTDWQAPWCLLMTQARGESTVYETVFENRFGYVSELLKTGADITLFNPQVSDPEQFYNFNWSDNQDGLYHAARILGMTTLHNAVMNITDLRAGATLVLSALGARGESILHGVSHIERGYENLDKRLNQLGASINRVTE